MASRSQGKKELARRYARALFDLADEKGVLDAVAGDIQNLAEAVVPAPEFSKIANNPLLNGAKLQSIVGAIGRKLDAHALTAQFLKTVAENRRLDILDEIVEIFQALLAQKRGQIRAMVTTARPLDAQEEQTLAAALKSATQQEILLEKEIDEEILGGMVVRIGSLMVDDSVAGKLTRLAARLRHSSAGQSA